MRHLPLRLLIICALAALALGLTAAPAAHAAASASPAAGPAGTRFNFAFDGFAPGERVDPWVTSPTGQSFPRFPQPEADAAGAVAWSYDIPADATPGVWTAVARGVRSDTRASVSFTVSAGQATAPQQSVAPERGGPGTAFSFYAAGFRGGERVGAWLVQPDGTSRELSDKVFWQYADPSGALGWGWTAPADAPPGQWLAVAEGAASGYQARIAFTLLSGNTPPPERSITPASGAPGTSFSVVAGGLPASERVGAWLIRPDGGRVDLAQPWVETDPAGVARWSWTAPADAPGGEWKAVTRDLDGKVEIVLPFTITGTNPIPPAPGASGSVSPTSGQPGTLFTFRASGFDPGEKLFYWLQDPSDTPQRERTETFADPQGNATWTYLALDEPTARTGVWTMVARGERTRLHVQIPFTLLTRTPQVSVSPDRGGPGTTFSFAAGGFSDRDNGDTNPDDDDREIVDNWVNGPDGRTFNGAPGVRSDDAGEARWLWTAPVDLVAGTYEMIARGRDSQVTHKIAFTIERATPPPANGANTISVSPNVGGPGTTFTFTIEGYEPAEQIDYWLNEPDGAVVRIERPVTASPAGQVIITWQAPADAPRGTWLFVARSAPTDGIANDETVTAQFRVQ